MIDTVKLISPEITEEVAGYIEDGLYRRTSFCRATGDVAYDITSDQLVGSFDHRISVRVCRERLVNVGFCVREAEYVRVSQDDWAVSRQADMRDNWVMRPCAPYLIVEGSVHKALLGHNICGGPCDPYSALRWFVEYVGALLDLTFVGSLADGAHWFVERIDWAEVYRLGFVASQEFVNSVGGLRYPRRKVMFYPSESVSCPGTTTSFKIYCKGPEFAVHDAKRLRRLVSFDELAGLQGVANEYVRVEVAIKKKLLKEHFPCGLRVADLTRCWMEGVYDREVARFMGDGEVDMVRARSQAEVRARLKAAYGGSLGMSLFGLWCMLATVGEEEARANLSRTTYYRQCKQIRDAGCHWAGSDLVLRHSLLPHGFRLGRSEPSRDVTVADAVLSLTSPYRMAA